MELIVAGELHYRDGARQAYESKLQRRRELEAELVRRRAKAGRVALEAKIAAETPRRSALLGMAADLHAADDIRMLVARVLADRGGDDAAARWSAWALDDVANRLDPSRRLNISPEGHAQLSEPVWEEVGGA